MKTETEEDGWRGFLELCSKAKSHKELEALFGLFLTATERSEIANRYLIVQELVRGKMSQREIAKRFGISIAKITRGSNSLKIIEPDLRRKLIS